MQSDSSSLYERLLKLQATVSPARPPRASASVVLWRESDQGTEVYWVRRSPSMRFMGGWYAFPGGGLARDDAELQPLGAPKGTSEKTFTDADPATDRAEIERLGADLAPGIVTCALRELFEETGLLLTSETFGVKEASGLADARQKLLAKERSFAQLLDDGGWQLQSGALEFAGRWLTPPLAPMRFDNRFFLLRWNREKPIQPTLMGTELDFGEWIRPAEAIARWQRAEVTLAPPILHILKVLADETPELGLDRLRDTREANLGPFRRIELRPGVTLLPLLTPTLPPATHTHAYLIGMRNAVLVDPATPHEKETANLISALDAAREQGVQIQAIWLTHHHIDHIGAANAVRRKLEIPICAHPLAIEPLAAAGVTVDEALHDDQVVDLGHRSPFPVRIVHTPGHTRGHLSFFVEAHRSLIAGDLLSTLSTIVIDPPEGDMDAYLGSIDRALELRPNALFPAHGPAVLNAVQKLEELKQHRLEREAEILEAWRSGMREPLEMVRSIYSEVPEAIHPVAARQLQAHLKRLRDLGKLA